MTCIENPLEILEQQFQCVRVPCGPVPGSSAMRHVRGSRMIEVDIYSFFWLGGTTSVMQLLQSGVPLSVASARLAFARVALENLQSHPAARLLPETSRTIAELLALINNLLPPDGTQGRIPDRQLVNEISNADRLISDLFRYMRDETKHLYLLCVEDQRCLSAFTLIEKIESCFPEKAWKRIDKDAKREFDESGKCLAVERYTGAGFHSLRGVECVIRQWIQEVTGSLPRKRDWGHYCEVLKQNGADPSLVAVLDNIRTLERNPLMHPEDWLEVDDAIGIFNLSHTAIARLMSDLESKKPSAVPVTP